MNLKTYIAENPRGYATKLAVDLGVSLSYLSQMASGASAISPDRCVLIEKATGRRVARKDLRPNDWHLIWPELVPLDPMSTPTTLTKDEAERDGGMRLPMHTERVK